MIRITGDKLSTYLSVNGYDYEKQFGITNDDIKYIGFRIEGKGSGIYRFDNLVFRELNFSELSNVHK